MTMMQHLKRNFWLGAIITITICLLVIIYSSQRSYQPETLFTAAGHNFRIPSTYLADNMRNNGSDMAARLIVSWPGLNPVEPTQRSATRSLRIFIYKAPANNEHTFKRLKPFQLSDENVLKKYSDMGFAQFKYVGSAGGKTSIDYFMDEKNRFSIICQGNRPNLSKRPSCKIRTTLLENIRVEFWVPLAQTREAANIIAELEKFLLSSKI